MRTGFEVGLPARFVVRRVMKVESRRTLRWGSTVGVSMEVMPMVRFLEFINCDVDGWLGQCGYCKC